MKAWVVTVDMGLGHQRATYPLASDAEGGIIPVGGEQNSSPEESRLWSRVRYSYELISRCKSIPLVGEPLFGDINDLHFQIPQILHPIPTLKNPNILADRKIRGIASPIISCWVLELILPNTGRRITTKKKTKPHQPKLAIT